MIGPGFDCGGHFLQSKDNRVFIEIHSYSSDLQRVLIFPCLLTPTRSHIIHAAVKWVADSQWAIRLGDQRTNEFNRAKESKCVACLGHKTVTFDQKTDHLKLDNLEPSFLVIFVCSGSFWSFFVRKNSNLLCISDNKWLILLSISSFSIVSSSKSSIWDASLLSRSVCLIRFNGSS